MKGNGRVMLVWIVSTLFATSAIAAGPLVVQSGEKVDPQEVDDVIIG